MCHHRGAYCVQLIAYLLQRYGISTLKRPYTSLNMYNEKAVLVLIIDPLHTIADARKHLVRYCANGI